jgi:hypothetical protein
MKKTRLSRNDLVSIHSILDQMLVDMPEEDDVTKDLIRLENKIEAILRGGYK